MRRTAVAAIERHLERAPAGAVLAADVEDDAIEPCRQFRVAAEVRQPAVNLEKNLLCQIVGLSAIAAQPVDQSVDQALVAIDQFGKRRVVLPAPAALEQRVFIGLVHPPPPLERRPRGIVSPETNPGIAQSNVAYEAGAQ